MFRWVRRVGLVLITLLATACQGGAPDLIPDQASAGLDGSMFEVKFLVKNVGTAGSPAGALVYVEAINPTPTAGVSDIRFQKSFDIPPLAPGATAPQPFMTFWTPSQLQAEGVRIIRITVDVKRQISESNESNNIKEWAYPCGQGGSPCS